MLQIKNTLGGGKPEGLYAWKKNLYSPSVSLENPTFDYISATVSSSSSDYTFGNFSFDISIIDDWTKFFTGFVNTNGYGSNFPSDGIFHNYSDNRDWNYTVSEVNLSAGTVTIHIGGQCGDYKSEGTYKYTGTKVVSEEIKEFIDYIVSDKETAYPDGGEKDGYWYEKVVGDGLTPEMFGCTKMAIDKYTFASQTAIDVGIPHSLGVAPKYVFIFSYSTDLPPLSSYLIEYFGRCPGDSNGGTTQGWIIYSSSGEWRYRSLEFYNNKSVVKSNANYYYWLTGVEYTVVTMA